MIHYPSCRQNPVSHHQWPIVMTVVNYHFRYAVIIINGRATFGIVPMSDSLLSPIRQRQTSLILWFTQEVTWRQMVMLGIVRKR